MKLSILTGFGLAVMISSAAGAQDSAGNHASDTAAIVGDGQRSLQPGMVVTDRTGAKVATISQTNQIQNGQPAVLLDVDGTNFRVPASRLMLSPKGDQATTSLTSSDIRTLQINAD